MTPVLNQHHPGSVLVHRSFVLTVCWEAALWRKLISKESEAIISVDVRQPCFTRNSAVIDKLRDISVQMQSCGWPPKTLPSAYVWSLILLVNERITYVFPPLTLNGACLNYVSEFKYLGHVINNKLSDDDAVSLLERIYCCVVFVTAQSQWNWLFLEHTVFAFIIWYWTVDQNTLPRCSSAWKHVIISVLSYF